MQIEFRPMRPDEFDSYLERSVREYADEKVQAGNWPAESALERSRKEFLSYLPDGVASENQYLFTLADVVSGEKVGIIWYTQQKDANWPTWFILDFTIDEAYRRQGLAQQALEILREKARAAGIQNVSLHVFGFNTAARELYRKAGFEETNVMMTLKV